MQSIIDTCNSGALHASPVVVISNNSISGASKRTIKEGIPHYHISTIHYSNPKDLDRSILYALRIYSILPKYDGKGMYGIHVHDAVISAGEEESGVSIHVVGGSYDTVPIFYFRWWFGFFHYSVNFFINTPYKKGDAL